VKKIYLYTSPDGEIPFMDFLDSLDAKQRKKLEYALKCIALSTGKLSEPQVKHFSIERYRQLYELREKAQILIRIVFTFNDKGNVILLYPFIKRHKRNTNQALEASLKLLAEIENRAAATPDKEATAYLVPSCVRVPPRAESRLYESAFLSPASCSDIFLHFSSHVSTRNDKLYNKHLTINKIIFILLPSIYY